RRRATLFPCTTLFRPPAADQLGTLGVAQDIVGDFREGVVGAFGFAQDVVVPLALEFVVRGDQRIPLPPEPRGGEGLVGGVVETRSEEHTSELQSRENL